MLCWIKRSYMTEDDANVVLARIAAGTFHFHTAAERTRKPVKSYHCGLCGRWHVTHNPNFQPPASRSRGNRAPRPVATFTNRPRIIA